MPDSELDPKAQRKAMRNSDLNGMSYAAMVGMGESYIPAAALSLGATDFHIGMLSAFPQFLGAVFQFFSIPVIRLFGSRKWATLAGDLFQGLVYLPIIALLLWPGELSVPLLILFFSLGTAGMLMINPAWSSWVSDIVPDSARPTFFARRNRVVQLVLFISTFGAGYALRALELNYSAAIAFSLVFLGAAISRAFSAYFNFLIPDIKYEIQLFREIRFSQLFTLPGYRNELWFLMFMALINATTQFAAPFFIPHMIGNLHFDLGLVGMLIAIPVIAKVFFFPYWGWAADRFGNRAVLVSTSFLTPAMPLFWLLSSDPAHIVLFQIFSGFAWAGFDLAAFNYALSLVERDLRPSFISKYNAFNGFFYALGAVCGGLFLSQFPSFALLGFVGIPLVFLLSGIARLITFVIFSPKLSSAHEIMNTTSDRAMILQIVAVAPAQGAIQQVMHGWNFTRKAVRQGAVHGGWAIKEGIGRSKRFVEGKVRKI
jgi:MFS family permease